MGVTDLVDVFRTGIAAPVEVFESATAVEAVQWQYVIEDLIKDLVWKTFEKVPTRRIEVLNTLSIRQRLDKRVVEPVFVLFLKKRGRVAVVIIALSNMNSLIELRYLVSKDSEYFW